MKSILTKQVEFVVRFTATVPVNSKPEYILLKGGVSDLKVQDGIPATFGEYETMSVYPAGESPTKVGTVNVIEINGAPENTTVHSFLDTPAGNKAAEEHFTKCFDSNNCDGDVAEAITDGIGEIGTYTLLLVHSEAK